MLQWSGVRHSHDDHFSEADDQLGYDISVVLLCCSQQHKEIIKIFICSSSCFFLGRISECILDTWSLFPSGSEMGFSLTSAWESLKNEVQKWGGPKSIYSKLALYPGDFLVKGFLVLLQSGWFSLTVLYSTVLFYTSRESYFNANLKSHFESTRSWC